MPPGLKIAVVGCGIGGTACALMLAGRGHVVVAGSPTQIADEIERWFTEGAADGFNIMPPTLPGGLEDFVDLVVPELQRRKLFRTEYEGRTLRENLGLPRPANRFFPTRA